MLKKRFAVIVLILFASCFIVAYADEVKNTNKSKSGSETHILGHLSNIYEPIEFAHEMHTLITESCQTCHHNSEEGETPSCQECHIISSKSKDLDILSLKDAYHRQCIGCHKELDAGPTNCTQCHFKKKVKVASAQKIKSEKIPDALIISHLEKKYESVMFNHNLHTEMTDDCSDCHHHSESGDTPSCTECHGAPFNPDNLNLPGLKGAYHLQCMGCHKDLGSGPIGCNECHAKKISKTEESTEK